MADAAPGLCNTRFRYDNQPLQPYDLQRLIFGSEVKIDPGKQVTSIKTHLLDAT